MISALSIFAGSLVLFQAGTSTAAAVPLPFHSAGFTRANLNEMTVQRELDFITSDGTVIFGASNTSQYAEATERWVTYVKPDIRIVVQPSEEADVAKIVKYCNANSIEFLTRNRGHGFTTSLNNFSGLEIDMVLLQEITIHEDTETALLQGGVWAGPLIDLLWDEGYVTATGAAYCVGMMGLGLGGGHGRLQGTIGLVTDGLVHLNVVLADGSKIGVNSTSHSDLFWAMRGAGHNFGIVTSYVVKIYPRPENLWHYHSYVWTGDKLEAVFEQLNNLSTSDNGTTPPLMAFNGGVMAMNSSISTTEPVLSWSFAYNGAAADAEALLQPFNAIGAAAESMGDVPYPEIADVQGTGKDGAACQGGAYVISSNLLVTYNLTTERQHYEMFSAYAAEHPELANTARLAYEGYATKAFHDVPHDSTAYPHRSSNFIVYFLADVTSNDLYDAAQDWAKDTWTLWTEGKESKQPDIYVNYAAGHSYESLESVYGYESWRLQRLRSAKAKYDPHNRFRFYVPLLPEKTR
ncbi:hypothetical protein SLS53_003071 [Cytospora paraplurivora]|uniref:FAD-binding PCMH-type domain-containing protein n=1 Tax=Cytospora paraplurivora TaxID=2898453 RepID=A0AAN9UCX7_9PEZI